MRQDHVASPRSGVARAATLACALAALRLGVSRALAAVGTIYALWALWGADLKASGLSLVLMVAGLPIYWWAVRERAVKGPVDRYSAR